jgi:hypothetical protein
MLHTVDQNNLLIFEDLVDDAVVATPRRPQTLEFTNERLEIAEHRHIAPDGRATMTHQIEPLPTFLAEPTRIGTEQTG